MIIQEDKNLLPSRLQLAIFDIRNRLKIMLRSLRIVHTRISATIVPTLLAKEDRCLSVCFYQGHKLQLHVGAQPYSESCSLSLESGCAQPYRALLKRHNLDLSKFKIAGLYLPAGVKRGSRMTYTVEPSDRDSGAFLSVFRSVLGWGSSLRSPQPSLVYDDVVGTLLILKGLCRIGDNSWWNFCFLGHVGWSFWACYVPFSKEGESSWWLKVLHSKRI